MDKPNCPRSTSTWWVRSNLPKAQHLSMLRSLLGITTRPAKASQPPEAKSPTLPTADPAYLDRLATPDTSTPTTGGATSATDDRITHTSRLVETHRITLPAGATGDNVAVARLHAEAYARARGFELGAGEFSVLGINGPDQRSGVQFTLTVGVGDIALDQRVPGVLDRWTWSAGAVEWWQRRLGGPPAKLLSLVDGAGRRRTGRLTGIRPIEGDPGAVSVEGEFIDSPGGFHGVGKPGWLGPDALRGFTAAEGLGFFDDETP